MLTSFQAAADGTHDKAKPSCDEQAQRSVKGETGGSITDPLEAYISVRVNLLQADISTARKSHRLTYCGVVPERCAVIQRSLLNSRVSSVLQGAPLMAESSTNLRVNFAAGLKIALNCHSFHLPNVTVTIIV